MKVKFFKNKNKVRDLRDVFKEAYYHIYTNDSISRADRLMSEFIKFLHCLLMGTTKSEYQQYKMDLSLEDKILLKRFHIIFEKEKQKNTFFRDKEEILLDDESLIYLLRLLSDYNFDSIDLDVLAGAFESLINSSIRGDKGQFFTPRNLTKTIIDLLEPRKGDKIIDPACGTGGFLVDTTRYLEKESIFSLTGIDKDFDMYRLSHTYLEVLGVKDYKIINFDSLDVNKLKKIKNIMDESYDVVVTNPPFGTKIQVTKENILINFELGYKWKRNRDGKWEKTDKLLKKQHPQILFIERCLQLLKPDGKMAIILPEGLFTSKKYGYIWSFIHTKARVNLIIDCVRTTFQPSTDTKTNVLFLRKRRINEEIEPIQEIKMSIAEYSGHDRRGRLIEKDDFPLIIKQIKSLNNDNKQNRCGFKVYLPVSKSPILIPRYYDYEINEELNSYKNADNINLVSVKKLIKNKVLNVRKGDEVGSKAYGTGDIPFIRTSDISNWEITHNSTNAISEEYYNEYANKQNLKPLDILFVNDGRYRIGKICILGVNDTNIVVQSHIKIITVNTPNKYNLDSYILLYLLSQPIVKKQIKSKTFIQSTIASLGNRFSELLLPIPKNDKEIMEISNTIKNSIDLRNESLEKMRGLMGQDFIEII